MTRTKQTARRNRKLVSPPRHVWKISLQNRLTEDEKALGITEYLSNAEGFFSGFIKVHHTDFHMNEINLDGEVAKLTDTSDQFVGRDWRRQDLEITPSVFIPQETWTALRNLAWDESGEPIYLNIDNTFDEDRKAICSCIKNYFGNKISRQAFSTKIGPYVSTRLEFRFKENKKEDWPKNKGDYVYFIVKKEMIDTIDACFLIANCARIDASKFTYAENKDERGITTQWFCVKQVEPWKLLNGTMNQRNVKVGNFSFKDRPLKLRQLKGNHFTFALRSVSANVDIIEESIRQLKENGFVNYYGLQSLGNYKEVPLFDIGIKLLKGEWQEAVNLILKPREFDNPMARNGDVVEAKKVYADTKNAEDAFAKINVSKYKCIEAELLESLTQTAENDYYSALQKVPRTMTIFYIHALQSLIWNRMVSKRLQLFGKQPVEGDLVLINKNNVNGYKEMDQGEVKMEVFENESEDKIDGRVVKPLTAADLANFTMYDIVLPTPGSGVTYPANMEKYYKKALEKFEILDIHNQETNIYMLEGNYRNVLGRVNDLSWDIAYPGQRTALINPKTGEVNPQNAMKGMNLGKNKAVVLKFSLPVCSCPRMVLRELVKLPTEKTDGRQKDIFVSHINLKIPKEDKSSEKSTTDAQNVTKEFQSNSRSVKRKNDEEKDGSNSTVLDENQDSHSKKIREDKNI